MGLREYLKECGTPYNLPSIAGQYAGKKVVVCADAQCVWDDLERFGCRSDRVRGKVEKDGWDFLTVNHLVSTFPGNIEHAYSNGPVFLKKCIAARREEYAREFSGPKHIHSHSPGATFVWPFGGHGSSGLGACLVAISLGYDRVVICGMPLDDGPHNGEPHWRRTAFQTSEVAGGQRTARNAHWWKAKQFAFDDKVRSMSGRTREWLGDAMAWS